MTPKSIELHIEELVLHGFAPGDRYRIGEAVEQELSRLLADRGVPESLVQGGDFASVDGGAFEVVSGARAEVVGAQVAQAVYGGAPAMSGRVHAEAQAAPKSSFTPVRTGLLAGYREKQLVSQPPLVQAKLTINQPNDWYEQEADRVADDVMRMPEPEEEEEETLQIKPLVNQITPLVQVPRQEEPEEEVETLQAKPLAEQITPPVQRQIEPTDEEEWPPVYYVGPTGNAGELEEEGGEEELIQTKPLTDQITPLIQRLVEEEEEETLQTKGNPGQTPEVTPDLESRIQSLKGSGQPLPEANRGFMERRFGIDFSGVRLHTDSDAAQMSRGLNAEAFTHGKGIYWLSGISRCSELGTYPKKIEGIFDWLRCNHQNNCLLREATINPFSSLW